MKKTIYFWILAGALCIFASCSNDEPNNVSIFDTEAPVREGFDKWLLGEYVMPYNIDFKYKMESIESSLSHYLTPAKLENSIALAKIIKYVWLESYEEVVGRQFIRSYTPRMIHLIGSPAYNNDGTMIVGQAEGGLKVTMYMVNSLDVDNINMATLNYFYLKTMHHEFGHILHQTKNYDPAYKLISQGQYVGGNWYLEEGVDENGVDKRFSVYNRGFVTAYSMNIPDDDFVEMLAVYLTDSPVAWNEVLVSANATGRAILLKKFDILKNYMRDSWNVNIEELRKVSLRRTKDVENNMLDLKSLD